MQSRPISDPSSPCTSKPVVAILGRKCVVELREQSAGEAQDAHHAILQALAAHSAARSHCAHRQWLVIEDEPERVGVVDRDVHNDASARFGLLDPPALQMRRQVDCVKHPREQRFTDAPLDGSPPASPDESLRCEDDGWCPGSRRATRHSATIARASSSVSANGFSQRTCLPALAAAKTWSRCSSLVVEM